MTVGYIWTMLLRRIARPLLAGIFIYGGIGALRDLESHAQLAKPVLDTMADLAPTDRVPNAITLVKLDAGVKIGAGVLLALGRAPRFAAAALATSLIPTTLAGHRFWEIEDPQVRSDELIHFLKNLGLLGGLIITAADTAGRPSLAWRGRHAGRRAAAASQRKLAKMTASADHAGGKISGLTAGATGLATGAAGLATGAAEKAAEAAGRAAKLTTDVVDTASERGRVLAGKAARLGEEVAGKASSMGDDVAGVLADAASRVTGRLKTMAH